MRCCELGLSGSDSRFHLPTNSTYYPKKPIANLRWGSSPRTVVYYSTRVSFQSIRAKATINDELVAEAAEASFYELLGIPESGSLIEIKKAYKQLARKYHPDVSPPGQVEEYTKRFIRVQEAYETLSDPSRRALYDRDMAKGLHFAFSARKRFYHDEGMEEKSEWKNRWQSQLSELKKRSMNKDGRGNMSWGARMRRQRAEQSEEL